MHDNGRLLVAAAGNDGNNVDAEDCAWPFDWPCWERAWYAPCENSGVFCVGALQVNSDKRLRSSNFGSEDVDLFGPGTVWVGRTQRTKRYTDLTLPVRLRPLSRVSPPWSWLPDR
jgi:hypothetical protein